MNYLTPQYNYRRKRQRKEFLFPFVVIICLGIIVVLVFQLIFAFKGGNTIDLNKRIVLYAIGENLEILATEQSSWIHAYNNTVLFAGDTVRTGEDTRAVLQFNDGNIVRLNENSQIIVKELDHYKEDGIVSQIYLSYGDIWMNKISLEGDYTFTTENSKIYSIGTIFALENREYETLRVLQGNVQFDVLENIEEAKSAIIESYIVRVGQELSLTDQALSDIIERKVVDLIVAISNEWEDMDWYAWNMKEDANPTDFIAIPKNTDEIEEETQTTENIIEDQTVPPEPDNPPVLYVTNPKQASYTLNADSIYIQGTVNGYAQSITVEAVNGIGVKDYYTLQKFKAGGQSWSYFASSSLNNLSEGKNTYTIFAKDKNGKASEKIYLEIIVPEGILNQEIEESSLDTEETIQPTENTEPVETTEPLQESTQTTEIGISSFNGETNVDNRYETSSDKVQVFGTVSGTVQKILVNGWELTLFNPGDSSWTYYAKPEFNTLNPGENYFTVYGLDENGNKTNELSFVIVKN